MKTSQALYDALEAVSDLEAAIAWDLSDVDTKPSGIGWLCVNRTDAIKAYKLLENMRDSLNDVE